MWLWGKLQGTNHGQHTPHNTTHNVSVRRLPYEVTQSNGIMVDKDILLHFNIPKSVLAIVSARRVRIQNEALLTTKSHSDRGLIHRCSGITRHSNRKSVTIPPSLLFNHGIVLFKQLLRITRPRTLPSGIPLSGGAYGPGDSGLLANGRPYVPHFTPVPGGFPSIPMGPGCNPRPFGRY